MRVIAAILLAGLAASSGCTRDAADPADRSGEVRLCPILRLKAEGPYTVPLTFSNGTDKPFNYFTSLGEIAGFRYSLRRNGKEVPGRPQLGPGNSPPVYTPHSVKPGEKFSFSYKLQHTELKPGEYDLQIVYRVYEGSTINLKNEEKYKPTPAHFTQNYTLILE